MGDEPRGERDAAKGLEEMDTDVEEGAGEVLEGDVSAAKSELAASEKRRDARFWLFVNLWCRPSVSTYAYGVSRGMDARDRPQSRIVEHWTHVSPF